jgi:hypothetical protein
MRKLLVSNFLTLDGYYESRDKTFGSPVLRFRAPGNVHGFGHRSLRLGQTRRPDEGAGHCCSVRRAMTFSG